MVSARQRVAALAVLIVPFVHSTALADRCLPAERFDAASRGGTHRLEARFDAASRSWKAHLKDARTGETAAGTLKGMEWHTHPRAFVADDGSRVVVVEPTAGGLDGVRLLVYDAKLRLLKSFTLSDLLTKDEVDRVTRSVSHLQFLEQDPETGADAWIEGPALALRVVGGRTVRVGIADPKVLEVKMLHRCRGEHPCSHADASTP